MANSGPMLGLLMIGERGEGMELLPNDKGEDKDLKVSLPIRRYCVKESGAPLRA